MTEERWAIVVGGEYMGEPHSGPVPEDLWDDYRTCVEVADLVRSCRAEIGEAASRDIRIERVPTSDEDGWTRQSETSRRDSIEIAERLRRTER